jgi:hypothetical protein
LYQKNSSHSRFATGEGTRFTICHSNKDNKGLFKSQVNAALFVEMVSDFLYYFIADNTFTVAAEGQDRVTQQREHLNQFKFCSRV